MLAYVLKEFNSFRPRIASAIPSKELDRVTGLSCGDEEDPIERRGQALQTAVALILVALNRRVHTRDCTCEGG